MRGFIYSDIFFFRHYILKKSHVLLNIMWDTMPSSLRAVFAKANPLAYLNGFLILCHGH
jgi:hypothetical protein